MANAYKSISAVLNIVQTLFGIALAGVSIWFFIELKGLTDLRNRDRFLLDFNVYWPQVIPWMYLVVSVFVICVSLCGFYSVCSGRKAAVITYITFLTVVTLAAFGAGIVGIVCGDSKTSDEFVSETVRDAYSQMKLRKDIVIAFGNIERRLRCCGMAGATDYTHGSIPDSCCDKDEIVDCESSASRRLGCVEVVVPYTRMFIKYTSIGAIVTGVACLASLIVAIMLVRTARSKKDRLRSEAEKEPLKLPL